MVSAIIGGLLGAAQLILGAIGASNIKRDDLDEYVDGDFYGYGHKRCEESYCDAVSLVVSVIRQSLKCPKC